MSVQTKEVYQSIKELEAEITALKKEVTVLNAKQEQLQGQIFQISYIKDNESKLLFCTGFASYKYFKACYNFLGPAVNCLHYGFHHDQGIGECCRSHTLPPIEGFF